MRTGAAFAAGALLATFAPMAGALLAAVMHERTLQEAWAAEVER